MYFFGSIKITSLFFQPEVVYNHDYKLHFVYCRFLCNCSLLNADLSVNIKNSGKKRSVLTRLQACCRTHLSSHFEFLFYHFKPRDHVAEKADSYSYNKDSASSLMNSEIAILLIRFAIEYSF